MRYILDTNTLIDLINNKRPNGGSPATKVSLRV